VSLYEDRNRDSVAESQEIIQTVNPGMILQPKDSANIEFTWPDRPSGEIHVIGKIEYEADLRLSDNIAIGLIRISFPLHSLIINEIMYEPASGQAEYVELFNRSPGTIDVHNWRIEDEVDTSATSKTRVISHSSFVTGRNEFLVIASDSSIFTSFPYLADSAYRVIVKSSLPDLNNDGDDIMLTDLTRTSIDSLHYYATWHNPDVPDVRGKSLERINPNLPANDKRNWSTSASPHGGTPGRQNSLYTITVPTGASLSFSPNPFSPDGDGFEDVTILSYELPSTTGIIRVRIFDAAGRLVRTLADSEPGGSHGELIWDGYRDNKEKARIGIYVVLLEALDANRSEVRTLKGAVVVAARM
jgi:hypothetical protein